MTQSLTSGINVRELIAFGQKELGGDSEAKAEAFELLASLLHSTALELRLRMNERIDELTARRFYEAIKRLQAAEPLAYISGRTYFFDYPLHVGKGVLIPRPDSEVLVLLVLDELRRLSAQTSSEQPLRALELCTGSACLSLAVAKEWEKMRLTFDGVPLLITATELEEAALGFARMNLQALLQEGKVVLCHYDLWPPQNNTKFDLLFANPPYVSDTEYDQLELSVKDFEPRTALWGGKDGLDFYRRILDEAAPYLKPGACLFLEHGYRQAEAIQTLAKHSDYEYLACQQDLAGRERVSVMRFIGEES